MKDFSEFWFRSSSSDRTALWQADRDVNGNDRRALLTIDDFTKSFHETRLLCLAVEPPIGDYPAAFASVNAGEPYVFRRLPQSVNTGTPIAASLGYDP